MKDNYDFSKGIKNPYADKMKNGYTVTVHYDFTKQDSPEENDKATDTTRTQFKEESAKYEV